MLPPLVDTFFDDAFKRLDDVSHGVLTDLTGPDVTFALSPNRSQLTARVLLPTHGRKLRMSLVARRHLQLRVHTQSESITAMAVHTLLLPVAVSADGVSISAHQDGTVHVVFKTVNESSASDHSIKPPVPSSATADHNSTNNAIRSSNMQRDVPQGDAVKRCAQEHRSCTIRFDACVCGAMDEEQGAIQCAAHVIQRCVQLLRRHRSDDEATGVKHAMMECTLSGGDVAACVERVMRVCVHAVTRRGTNHSGCAMETTIHVGGGALSNGVEDAIGERGRGRFEHYTIRWRLWVVMTLLMTALMALAAIALLAVRRVRRACERKAPSQLSSALVQRAVVSRKQL